MISEDSDAQRQGTTASRSKTVILNLTALFAATAFSILLAEIAVRALDLAPSIIPITKGRFRLSPNPKIGYEPIPNIHHDAESLDFYQYRGTGNSLGYRGPAYPEKKAPEAFRIAVLGDSIVEGIGIDQYDDLFTAKVERALREEGIPAEVLNFGVSGYNTQQEVATLKDKALRFDPDLVLLSYCLNDTASPGYWLLKPLLDEANQKENVHTPNSFAARYLIRSALYRLLRFRLFAPSADEKMQLTFEPYNTGDTVAESVSELASLSKSHGVQVIVVVFPHFTDRTFANYAFGEQHEIIRGIVDEQNLSLLDLLPAYKACRNETSKPLHRDNLHPNARGHTCAAGAITAFILESVIAETKPRRL
jgi:lysophospholipase L1-like esterase